MLLTWHDDNISKRNQVQSLILTNNPDMFCITETLAKNVLLKIWECEIQIGRHDCFSNINNSNCHWVIAIYTKIYLNARSYLTKEKTFKSTLTVLREKCPNTELFLVRILLYSDWIRRFTNFTYFYTFLHIFTHFYIFLHIFTHFYIFYVYTDHQTVHAKIINFSINSL